MEERADVLANRLRVALQLHDEGVRLMRQNLHRRHRGSSDEEVERMLRAWLAERPGAEAGDAHGVPVSWPRM